MGKINIKTGYGYFKDSEGNIIAKYELPKGEHPLRPGYTFVEIATKEELDNINIYMSPKTAEEIREEKIQAEMRQLAIESLQKKGEL